MSLYSTVNKILAIARKQPDVFEAGEGSIYDALNGRVDVAYPLVWLTQQQHPQDMAVDGDFNTFTFTMFYVDRLTSDKSNRLQVQSHAIEVLQNIVRELELETDLPTKNYVTFTEKFESLCAGAYLEFSIYDLIDDSCVETFAPPVLYHIYYHTTDGNIVDVHGVTKFGTGLLVFNRVIPETNYTHIDGNTYKVNGELIFYNQPTDVPENSMYRNINLDAIYLPTTVESIGNNAFDGCVELTTVGGSASTESIISYGFQVFRDTKIGKTFSFGSKTVYVDYYLFYNVKNFPDGILNVNMTTARWERNVNKDPMWLEETNVTCFQFTDGLYCGRVSFEDHEDIGSGVTETQVTFETNGVNSFIWNAWWNNDYIFCSGQWNAGEEQSLTVTGIPAVTYGSVYGVVRVEAVNENGYNYGDVSFAKAEPAEPYLRILTETGQTIPATDTAFTITWETNMSGFLDYSYVGPYSTQTGVTFGTAFTATFQANSTYSSLTRTFTIEGQSISWVQEAAYFNMLTPSAQTVPYNQTAVTIEWETDLEGPFEYAYNGPYSTQTGYTSGTAFTATFQENSTDEPQVRTFTIEGKTVTWTQEAPYFNLLTPAMQTVPASATTVSIEWETNIEPPYHFIYSSPYGGNEGDVVGTGFTVHFQENRTYEEVTRSFEIEGKVAVWVQEAMEQPTPVEYTFTFNNVEGETLDSGTTANTVTWNTDYPQIEYKLLDNDGFEVTSGETSDSGVTVEFSANTDSSQTIQYTFLTIDPETDQNISALTWYLEEAYSGDTPEPPIYTGETGDYVSQYFTVEFISGGTFGYSGTTAHTSFDYSKDSGLTWNTLSNNVDATFNAGETVLMRGEYRDHYKDGWGGSEPMGRLDGVRFRSNAVFNFYGNILSLVYCNDFREQTSSWTTKARDYISIFSGMDGLISAENLYLSPSANKRTFAGTFANCHNLVSAPALPLYAIGNYTFESMFHNCTSLVNVPDLVNNARNQGTNVYDSMFKGCTSLVKAPALPNAYGLPYGQAMFASMFEGCTSLTQAPAITGGKSVHNTFHSMFAGCTSLVNPPEFPAEMSEVGYQSHYRMFSGCTSLTSAPVMNITADIIDTSTGYRAAINCFYQMFFGCRNLSYVKCTYSGYYMQDNTYQWLHNVAANGTFVKDASMQNWPTGESGVPSGWTVVDAT